jgi:hypothetical protein
MSWAQMPAPLRLRRTGAAIGGLLAVLLPAVSGRAQPEPDADQPAREVSDPDDPLAAALQRVEQLEQVVIGRQPRVTFSGFIDAGFFAVGGDGTGFVQDAGPRERRWFPALGDRYAWVFLGDLLSTAINTRGEPADLGNPPGVARADRIASRGAPGFIANEVNVRLQGNVAENARAVASVSFVPRSGRDFSLGDAFEVELAHLEWMLGRTRRTSIFVGKMDPVIGIEYRERKSDRRFGVTPSLIARYDSGTPVGIKLRSKLGESEAFVAAAALTNGSSGIEAFHFHDEVDSNAGKTGSLRLSLRPPLPIDVELGASGEYGSQDRALDSEHALWFFGFDLQVRLGRALLKAEWLRGRGAGETQGGRIYPEPHRPWGLDLRSGGYAELDVTVTPTVGLLLRAEHRDARVWLGDGAAPMGGDRMYLTKVWRGTVGARILLSERVVMKAEFLRNGEYGGLPDIPNDVFTSSLVLMY